MAQGKNNVLVYRSWLAYSQACTDEQWGVLMKHFFEYINDLNPSPLKDPFLRGIWLGIEQTLKRDLKNWQLKSEKNSESARLGARKRTHANAPDKDNVKDKDMDNVILSFEEFWDLYDKKVDRKRAQDKWKKVKEKDKPLIIRHIKEYKAAEPDKRYRKDPATYLYNESWNNEIIKKQPNGGKKSAASVFDKARRDASAASN